MRKKKINKCGKLSPNAERTPEISAFLNESKNHYARITHLGREILGPHAFLLGA